MWDNMAAVVVGTNMAAVVGMPSVLLVDRPGPGPGPGRGRLLLPRALLLLPRARVNVLPVLLVD